MLYIKLPKSRVVDALERVAESISNRISEANNEYAARLSDWRKDAAYHDEGIYGGKPERPLCIQNMTTERYRLQELADMAKHSKGDVYVSPELWATIKGYY